MIAVRKAAERGHTVIDWLDSYHTFSFDTYCDPRYENFRTLRVINEDRVKPAAGFHPHSHRDMEIITYVLEGELEHKDSLGNGSIIHPGEVQRMSAGTGVRHSEFNPSKKNPVHLLQIWILPEKRGLEPSYEQKTLSPKDCRNKLCALPVTIHQDAKIYASILDQGASVSHSIQKERGVWVQVARGELDLNGHFLKAGDGAAIHEEKAATLTAKKDSEFLLFDLK